ncbi:hypothetical protein AFCDBAGC_4687 [Methylobacterium cerastii]|uniref:Uncharacterized protein n=1 Tax=Methylobacterium cerastii TaxID=932741 RepID=A0ABQ4QNG5_9HYPH|nr:hypothetical protein [Methylobacterium cerastii]GJD46803.1 hypothetical protein AFCDBAGC_4687 [Methylobacterium cerastii]
MHDPADNEYQPPDYFDAFWEMRRAADASTYEQHVFNLELALGALRRSANPRVIDAFNRDQLRVNLIAAHKTSQRLLSLRYSAEQIELGYRAALGIANGWAIPLDEGRGDHVPVGCDTVLAMFWFDIINMRRANDLNRKLRGASLDAVLPLLPTLPSPTSCVVVLFPGSPKGPR